MNGAGNKTPPSSQTSAIRLSLVALLVAGTFFMENLDATIITPAIPDIASSFQVRPVDLNAGVSAYMLTVGLFIPASGWVADRFGARKVFALAIVLFTVASLLCGLARNLPEFIAVRILQGAGGAMMVPVGRLVVLRVTPKHRLIQAIATLTWPALVAPVLGPPLGGLIADRADWRWIFYLNLPIGVVAFIIALLLVPDARGEEKRPFDWSGFALCGSGLFCLLYVADLLGRQTISWLAVLGFGVLGVVVSSLAAWRLMRAPHPVVDLSSLRIETFAVTIWGGSLFRMSVSAVPFLLPLMFQLAFGFNAFQAGAMLMAVFAGNLLMKPMTTPVLRRFGFRRVLIGNGLLNVLGIAACAFFSSTTPLTLACAVLFFGGATRSMQFTALNTLAFSDVPPASMTHANTLFSAAFQLAMGLGVALGAIAWRIGEWAAPLDASPAWAFRAAFLIVAVISLAGVWDSMSLKHSAGEAVAKPRPKSG
jgi:EmrB/QacA subfamily drug resistance transporter